jgi:hypothetical protein
VTGRLCHYCGRPVFVSRQAHMTETRLDDQGRVSDRIWHTGCDPRTVIVTVTSDETLDW